MSNHCWYQGWRVLSGYLLVFCLGIRLAEAGNGGELPSATPAEVGMGPAKLAEARDYALTGEGSGLILRHGKVVLAWGDQQKRYDLKSTTKSFGSLALGLAIMDGKVRLNDAAKRHHPELGLPVNSNRLDWLDSMTILHLASQTAGFEKPGGYTRLQFEPGTQWDYSDSGPNWLAECLTLEWGRDLDEVLFERLFTPMGIGRTDLVWRKHAYRPALMNGVARREFGAGIHANVRAMARVGLLMLRQGDWEGKRLLPAEFCRLAPKTPEAHRDLPVLHPEVYGHAAAHYGLLWWNNEDGTLPGVPRDAYWSWGLYDSLIVVMPGLDVVVARAGQSWKRTPGEDHYAVLRPFLVPIALAVSNAASALPAPYPPSKVIRGIQWEEAVLRLAPGSDNWPMTWAEDDALYAAYGDGRGFEPFVREKLSMGLAKVAGTPPRIQGQNIVSATFDSQGDGALGRKASGILCVDGVLWAVARNATNAQLGWSKDHGATWQWADWRFATSFGCPTFLNFGQNYQGARDHYVYLYSPDSDSAYVPADRFVLARVPKHGIANRSAWEFFVQADGKTVRWSKSIEERGAVFVNPGNCYRIGVTYHEGLKRYLWVQVLPQSRHPQGPRFQGGFGIYEAPEPWGPWSTVFHTVDWDMGPGETASFPSKWFEAGGRTAHLVFSGNDAFSVRKARLELVGE